MCIATQPNAYFSLGYAAEQLGASPGEIVAAMQRIGATFAEIRNNVGQFDRDTFERLAEHFHEERQNGQGQATG